MGSRIVQSWAAGSQRCGSVRPSVRLPVCPSFTPLPLCSYHRINVKFSWVISNDRSNVRAKVQGQRSKVKVTDFKTPFSGFHTVTPVWINIWWWNDVRILMMLSSFALLFFNVIHQISRSLGEKQYSIFDQNWAFPDCYSSSFSPRATKCCKKREVA